MLAYCPSLSETFSRLRRLYQDRAPDLVLASMQTPSPALAAYARAHPDGPCADPDLAERTRFWDAYLSEHSLVCDDAIPSAYLSELDQGLYGALLGAEPQFMFDAERGWVSSMCKPLLYDLSELNRLAFTPETAWARRYERQLDLFTQAAAGKFGVSHFILIDGLNFLFELAGATQTFLSVEDAPEAARRAVDLAFRVNAWVHDTFFSRVPLLAGGTCSNFAQWLPGRIVSESVDPFHLTSVRYFEAWGRKNVEHMLAHYDGGVVHLHGNGRHLLEAVSALRGLKAIALLDDEGYPRYFDELPTIRRRVGAVPLIVKVEHPAFRAALDAHTLTGGVFYKVLHVPDVSEANRLADRVRSYQF